MIARAKKTAKYILAIFLYYLGILALFSFLRGALFTRRKYAILMYHRVLDKNDDETSYVQPGLYITRGVFEKQMAFLSRKYNLISLERMTGYLNKKKSPPLKSMAITFDDGWKDNYLYAYPILKKYNVPATIFLTTDFIDSDNTFWFNDINMILAKKNMTPQGLSGILKKVLSDDEYGSSFQYLESGRIESVPVDSDKVIDVLKKFDPDTIMRIITELKKETGDLLKRTGVKRQMLSWEDVVEMQKGGIKFGSHGCSHRMLPGLGEEEIKRELTESKKIMEEKLGEEVEFFTYPNGDYNDRIRNMVKDCGYIGALTTGDKAGQEAGADIYSLKRINVHEDITVNPRGDFSEAMFALHIFRNS